MTFPATNLNEAVGLIIPDSNAFHDVINGSETEEILLPEGDLVPTLRKALKDLEQTALIRSKTSDIVSLAPNQTTVTVSGFNASLSAYYIDGVRLVYPTDYTYADITTETITLSESKVGGSELIATSLDPTGTGVYAESYQFNTFDDLDASSSLVVNAEYTVLSVGARYICLPSSTTVLAGDRINASGQVLKLQKNGENAYNLSWFGVVDDYDNTYGDQYAGFELAASRAGKTLAKVIVDVSARINTSTISATTWVIPPKVLVHGLPAVSPSFDNDLTRLTGTVEYTDGVDQYGTLYIGDPSRTAQKLNNGGSTSVGQVNGASVGGTGVLGSSFGDDTQPAQKLPIAVQGVTVNNSTSKTVWGAYQEVTHNAICNGNSFGIETSIFNYGDTATLNPAFGINATTGATVGHHITAGADRNPTDKNASAAITLAKAGGAGAWEKGLVIFNTGVVGNDAIAMMMRHKIVWHNTSGQRASETNGYEQKLWGDQGNVPINRFRKSNIGRSATVSDDILGVTIHEGWNGTSEFTACTTRGVQSSDIGGGVASGRFDILPRDTAGNEYRYSFTHNSLAFGTNNQFDIGSSSVRAKTIWLVNSPDVSSDQTKKSLRDTDGQLTTSEKQAALAIARLPKMFKWLAEIDEKSGTSETVYLHCSPMAQSVLAAFEDAGLDPTLYGFISNEDGAWSIKPQELLWMICAAQQEKIDSFESRIAALENL